MSVDKYIEQIESFKDKKIVLIGGTSGVGLELLRILIKKEATIVLLARNIYIAQMYQREYPNIVDVIKYDQSSFESIDHAIEELVNKHKDINTIVLNAGVLGDRRILDNGYPATIEVNYIGARYFIDTISPKLKNNVRFVIQGSLVAGLNLKKPIDLKRNYGTFKQYNVSKIYLESYIYKLYSENKYSNVEYVITEPGVTGTRIIRNLNKLTRFLGKYFLKACLHSPKKASLCLLTGISNKSKNGDLIVPRGLFTLSGYPKIIDFPQKRRRSYLLDN